MPNSRPAQQALPPSVWSYVAGGAGDERTQDVNATAFANWGLMPRMLVGATERDLSVELWKALAAPIFMAPIGVIALCAQDGHGDLATARAAAATDVPMCVSTSSRIRWKTSPRNWATPLGSTSCTVRPIGRSPRVWCTARKPRLRGHCRHAGYLDPRLASARSRDLELPQLRGHCLANYTSDPVFRQKAGLTEGADAARPSCSGRAFSANLSRGTT
jgi:lactate 2-monooxygenase